MKWMLIASSGLKDFLALLANGRDVFALQHNENGSYRLTQTSAWDSENHTLGAYRQTEPLKALFFPAREFIGSWQSPSGREPMRERIVFGVKNCDLSSLSIYDHVFMQGTCKDPYYTEAREKTLLISADCTACLDVCFCPVVGEQPHAESGFDINIATTPAGCVIESGTERGEKLLQSAADLLEPADAEALKALEDQREEIYQAVLDQCLAHGLTPGMDFQAAVESTFDSTLWQEFAQDCVECGACNFICCTCHCFLLADGVDARGQPARTKLWDACLYSGFARTAGGGNPRPLRAERLRNRFDKKFSFFPQTLGRYACDGCGRCTEACIANIDIRAVLRRAVDESDVVHAHTGDH